MKDFSKDFLSTLSAETIATHSLFSGCPDGSVNPPIHLSNAYNFKDTEYAAGLFALNTAGYIYTRLHNPTITVMEDTICQLEGGAAAVGVASGHFAEFMTIGTLCKAGDNIVSSSHLYGGTHNLFSATLSRYGIEARYSSCQDDLSSFEKLIDDNTKAIYIETLPNPSCEIPDIEEFAKLAHKHNLPLVIDNTCATPYLVRPIDYGADIVLHSCTKFLGGHGAVMGGVIVDSGNFDWTKSPRFKELCEPDASYHGLSFTEAFGSIVFALKLRAASLRDIGGQISPFNAAMITQGIATLHVRMDRHVENALKLAKYLSTHPQVSWVNYPGLEGNKSKKMADKYFKHGAGSMLAFGVKGGAAKGKAFIEKVKICLHVANLGDVKTIVTHPATTTHSQLGQEELKAAGISDDLVRVSVGIENIDDLIKDFDQALK